VGGAGRSVVHADVSFAQPEIAINTCSRGGMRLPPLAPFGPAP
jgi:hypothetical protein